jgi:hypothetical protein
MGFEETFVLSRGTVVGTRGLKGALKGALYGGAGGFLLRKKRD